MGQERGVPDRTASPVRDSINPARPASPPIRADICGVLLSVGSSGSFTMSMLSHALVDPVPASASVIRRARQLELSTRTTTWSGLILFAQNGGGGQSPRSSHTTAGTSSATPVIKARTFVFRTRDRSPSPPGRSSESRVRCGGRGPTMKWPRARRGAQGRDRNKLTAS